MKKNFLKYLSGINPLEVKLKKSDVLPLRRVEYDEKYQMTLRDWLIYHQKEIVFNQVTWMGTRAFKNVLDAWIYQEIIYEIKPDVLIEIGSNYGGSTKYFAHLFDIIGKGQVVSIDLDRTNYDLQHHRVMPLTGSSSDPEIISKVEELTRKKRTIVIHDGDHNKTQALADLEIYSKYVSKDSYFIMEDGIVDLFHDGDELGFKKSEPGPLQAIEEFLQTNDHFVIDTDRERYLLTYNPKGFLKRII